MEGQTTSGIAKVVNIGTDVLHVGIIACIFAWAANSAATAYVQYKSAKMDLEKKKAASA